MKYIRKGNIVALALTSGDEIIESIKSVCHKENIKCATISGIGATNYAEIGLLKADKRTYTKKIAREDLEISSMVGNVTIKEGELNVHIHITLTTTESAFGGHVFKCIISAVADVFLNVIDMNIEREILDDGTIPMKFE
jgi:uncharacterized protein